MSTRVLLARHGDTAASQSDRFATMDLALSPEGRIHATELAVRLARYPIDAIYASSLQRAMDTAEFTARVHGLAVTAVPDLREIDHGVWADKTRDEIIAQYGQAQLDAYDNDPYHFRPAGGESGEEVLQRAAPALQKLVRQHLHQTILIVAHKATNRLLLCHFLGIDPRAYRKKLAQRPACLNVLRFPNANEAQLLLMNDIGHYAMSHSLESEYTI